LLGYVAGEMLVGEALFKPLLEAQQVLRELIPVACALLVLVLGKWIGARKAKSSEVVDLVDERVTVPPHEKS
jgi:hypothetical protein